jgi:hypothetical protein
MIIIKCYDWGDFEGNNLEEVKEKFVNAIVNSSSNPDISIKIDDIDYHGELVSKRIIREVEVDIEYKVNQWHKVAKIEREGLRRAQQEAMEG